MQAPQSHPPSNLLQPSRPTIATHSSESTTFGPQGFAAGTSTPHPPSSPPDPSRPLTRVLPLFSKFAPLRGTVRIKVEDAVFYCHREVLALASPFFQGVLAGGWAETEPSCGKEASFLTISPVCDEGEGGTDSPDPEEPDLHRIGPEAATSAATSHAQATGDTRSFTTTFTASSVVEDANEDDDPLDATFVECRLRIHEESASSFQDLLCHIYPRLECAIHWSNVEDLCRMGLKFDIPTLTSACLAFLLPSAAGRPALCMKIAEASRSSGLDKLRFKLTQYCTIGVWYPRIVQGGESLPARQRRFRRLDVGGTRHPRPDHPLETRAQTLLVPRTFAQARSDPDAARLYLSSGVRRSCSLCAPRGREVAIGFLVRIPLWHAAAVSALPLVHIRLAILTVVIAQVDHLSEFAVPRAFPLVACAALALHGVSDTRETRRGRVSKL